MSDVRLDATSLRGLAHPLRVRILGQLREQGPATATTLADRLGQSTGATSYHLRQLATYGFVEDDPTRNVGRERWWKASHQRTVLDTVDLAPEAEGYLRAVAAQYAERVDRWLGEYAALDRPWHDSSTLSDWRLRLTPAEAAELHTALFALVDRYRLDDADGAGAGRRGEGRRAAADHAVPGRWLGPRRADARSSRCWSPRSSRWSAPRMAALALPWFVLATTGSATKTGVVAFAELLPVRPGLGLRRPADRPARRPPGQRRGRRRERRVPGRRPAVARADRVRRRGRARGGRRNVLRLRRPPKRAAFPRDGPTSGVDMTRARRCRTGCARLATLLGAPAGGLLIAAFDAPTVLAIDAATFAVGALIVAVACLPSPLPPRRRSPTCARCGPAWPSCAATTSSPR